MGSQQYRVGNCNVVNGSQIVIGASTDWLNQLSAAHVFKVDLDNEATYTIGSIQSATRMTLAANYLGSTNTSLDYMVCRSFTTNKSYWRPLQGDYDFAEILSQNTIDKIDTDIANLETDVAALQGGVATVSDVVHLNASLVYSKAYRVNPQIKTANYQLGSRDDIILASGNILITLASASDRYQHRIVNRCATSTASVLVKKSGGDTIQNATYIKLASKFDSLVVFGDGDNTHIIQSMRRGVPVEW